MSRLGLVFTDELGNTHVHSFRLKQSQWDLMSVNNDTQNGTFFTGWANAVKPLLQNTYNIQSMRYINNVGAIVAEYIPGAAVAGTSAATALSSSATIGFTYSAKGTGANGKGSHATSHLKTGNGAYAFAGFKTKPCASYADVNAYRTWLVANMPVAVGNDVQAQFRTYFTMQYNAHYQRKYGN